jgi:hypothetical protein
VSGHCADAIDPGNESIGNRRRRRDSLDAAEGVLTHAMKNYEIIANSIFAKLI